MYKNILQFSQTQTSKKKEKKQWKVKMDNKKEEKEYPENNRNFFQMKNSRVSTLQHIYIYLMISSRSISRLLNTVIRYESSGFVKGEQPYNLRWQWKWKHAYYTYPKDSYEHAYVKKPEDTPVTTYPFHTVIQDVILRVFPTLRMYWNRRSRVMDSFQMYALPASFVFFTALHPLAFGFKMLAYISALMFYIRVRDKCVDPDVQEKFLRDMIHEHPELGKLFRPQTIHVLDHKIEYDAGYPDAAKFPEYNNKTWRFFNSDSGMCTGHFVMGDLQSNAVMTLKFKTMPAQGKFRFQVGEPFFYYDVRAELTHEGKYQEIVIVDEKESLNKHRPFLYLI